jgi:uncharacterized membrane-anchored protein YhcB (DUF1043 family)
MILDALYAAICFIGGAVLGYVIGRLEDARVNSSKTVGRFPDGNDDTRGGD